MIAGDRHGARRWNSANQRVKDRRGRRRRRRNFRLRQHVGVPTRDSCVAVFPSSGCYSRLRSCVRYPLPPAQEPRQILCPSDRQKIGGTSQSRHAARTISRFLPHYPAPARARQGRWRYPGALEPSDVSQNSNLIPKRPTKPVLKLSGNPNRGSTAPVAFFASGEAATRAL